MNSEKTEMQGYLKIKRKMFWADRFAEIKDHTFFYYKTKGDSLARGSISLSGISIQEKKQFPNEKLIILSMKGISKNETLQIKLDNEYEHNKWFNCFQANCQTLMNKSQTFISTQEKAFETPKMNFSDISPDKNEKEIEIVKPNWIDPIFLGKTIPAEIINRVKTFANEKENELTLTETIQNLSVYCSNEKNKRKDPIDYLHHLFEKTVSKIGVSVFFVMISIAIMMFSVFLLLLLALANIWAYLISISSIIVLVGSQFIIFRKRKDNDFIKIKAKSQFPCNINEILLILFRDKSRKDWQKNVVIAEEKGGVWDVRYRDGAQEILRHFLFKDEEKLYFAEFDKTELIRVFEIQINSRSSPLILIGLWNYICEKRFEPDSFLYEYGLKRNIINDWYWSQAPNISRKMNPIYFENEELIESEKEEENEKRISKRINSMEVLAKEEKNMMLNTKTDNNFEAEEEEEKIDERNEEKINEKMEEKVVEKEKEIEKIPEKYKEYYNDVLEAQKKFKEIYPLENFKWNFYDSKEDVKIHLYDDKEKGITWTRGEGVINKPAKEIMKYLQDLEAKKTYDKMYESGKVLEIITENFNLNYQKFKGIFPVGPRDFVLAAITEILDNGTIYIIATSVNNPDYPETKKTTRGWIYLGGWLLQPLDENTTNLVYITLMDPKGSIPKKLVEMSAKNQSLSISGIRKQLLK